MSNLGCRTVRQANRLVMHMRYVGGRKRYLNTITPHSGLSARTQDLSGDVGMVAIRLSTQDLSGDIGMVAIRLSAQTLMQDSDRSLSAILLNTRDTRYILTCNNLTPPFKAA